MRKAAGLGGLLLFLFWIGWWSSAKTTSSAPAAGPAEVPVEGQTFRILLGSPRLLEGNYLVRVTAPPKAGLRTRPWMATELEGSDREGTTWRVPVPAAPPYAAHVEGHPRDPLSGVLVDLEEGYRGPVQVRVSERSFTFRPEEVLLGSPRDFLEGLVRVERVPGVLTLAGSDFDEDYPSLAAASDGSLWAAWVEFDGRADRIRVVRLSGEEWTDLGTPAGPGDLFRVALAQHAGAMWVVWSEQRDENWDLYARTHDGSWSEEMRLTTSPYPDWNHRLAGDQGGGLWLVWQGGSSGPERSHAEIFLKVRRQGQWSRPLNVSQHPANDWEPALAVRDGTAYIAWDSYRRGDYDLFLARSDGETVSQARPLVATANFEVRADLVLDSQDRLWFSWEEADPEWGMDSVAFQRGLHRERRIQVRCLQGEEVLAPPPPWHARWPHLGPQAEMARLATDGRGRLWLFFRVNYLNRIWQQAAAYLDGDRWSEPFLFDPSYGRQAAPLGVARLPRGDLAVSWVSDTRVFQSPFHALHNDVHLTRIPLDLPRSGRPLSLQPVAPLSSRAPEGWQRSWPDYRLETDTRSYRLLWGELHRHTDINHHGRPDGALEDAYRYAFDVAQLDFFAATDHITGEPDQFGINPMTWWRSQKYADLHRFSGVFEPLYGYERSQPSPGGHKNLIFARRGGPLLKGTAGHNVPTDLWAALDWALFPVVVIPHQLTGPAIQWRYHNPRYEPVLELYQGRRQSYEYDGAPQPPGVEQIWGKREGSWAWDALAAGLKMGFIASSDHASTHMSYAAVYAENLSRSAVLEALQAKRTYAASDNIVLDFRVEISGQTLLMGESGVGEGRPRVRVKALGTAPVKTVEVIRNNQFVYAAEPGTREVEFSLLLAEPIQEDTYIYIRLIQADGQMAWSSPVWLEVR